MGALFTASTFCFSAGTEYDERSMAALMTICCGWPRAAASISATIYLYCCYSFVGPVSSSGPRQWHCVCLGRLPNVFSTLRDEERFVRSFRIFYVPLLPSSSHTEEDVILVCIKEKYRKVCFKSTAQARGIREIKEKGNGRKEGMNFCDDSLSSTSCSAPWRRSRAILE